MSDLREKLAALAAFTDSLLDELGLTADDLDAEEREAVLGARALLDAEPAPTDSTWEAVRFVREVASLRWPSLTDAVLEASGIVGRLPAPTAPSPLPARETPRPTFAAEGTKPCGHFDTDPRGDRCCAETPESAPADAAKFDGRGTCAWCGAPCQVCDEGAPSPLPAREAPEDEPIVCPRCLAKNWDRIAAEAHAKWCESLRPEAPCPRCRGLHSFERCAPLPDATKETP